MYIGIKKWHVQDWPSQYPGLNPYRACILPANGHAKESNLSKDNSKSLIHRSILIHSVQLIIPLNNRIIMYLALQFITKYFFFSISVYGSVILSLFTYLLYLIFIWSYLIIKQNQINCQ